MMNAQDRDTATEDTAMAARFHQSPADYDRQVVGCAFAIINRKGWGVQWDNSAKCWDIETPHGWRTCVTSGDLWNLIRSVAD